MRLKESGIALKLLKKYIPSSRCADTASTEASSLALVALQGAFFILTLGCFVSFIVLMIEIYVGKKRKKTDQVTSDMKGTQMEITSVHS